MSIAADRGKSDMSRSRGIMDERLYAEYQRLMAADLLIVEKCSLKDLYDPERGESMITKEGHWATGSFPVIAPTVEWEPVIFDHSVEPRGHLAEVPVVEADARDMTAAALAETEGDTERAELAAGICQNTWRSYPHVNIRPDDPTVYRQHRCGRTDAPHRGVCRCRYCGQDRSAA